ncbi:cytidylyltransferase domain-containing protein [Desertibaculum subflavum]|uniref:cytidylyltransferase domain-containing protein n=1 Tax=Desertibaculum subflavum TaxID=2268458 RepID=UPI000E6687AD
MSRTVATIEARMTSSRLPGKVMMEIAGRPALELMVERLSRVPSLDGTVIATTVNAADQPIVDLAGRLGIGCFRGSEEDVLARVLGAAEAHAIDVIVETTGDCPLIDPAVVERTIQAYRASGADYVANVLRRTYPIGMDTQVFARSVLADVARRTGDPYDHEHVSVFIYRHPELYRLLNVAAPNRQTDPELRLTLDTADDLKLLRALADSALAGDPGAGLDDILAALRGQPALRALNSHVVHRHVAAA